MISASVVSHGHGKMVTGVVEALLECPDVEQVIVTYNVPEPVMLEPRPRLTVLKNRSPKGFGANHNAAFLHCQTPFFCPVNPDVQLVEDPFPGLLKLVEKKDVGVVGPLVVAPDGHIEDSWRKFPTFLSLLGKLAGGGGGVCEMEAHRRPFQLDWIAGMFMLFDAEAFRDVGGFDEGFYLYYEDVDICARLWGKSWQVMACPSVSVVHDAQRASRKKFQYMKRHLASVMRYLWKHGWNKVGNGA